MGSHRNKKKGKAHATYKQEPYIEEPQPPYYEEEEPSIEEKKPKKSWNDDGDRGEHNYYGIQTPYPQSSSRDQTYSYPPVYPQAPPTQWPAPGQQYSAPPGMAWPPQPPPQQPFPPPPPRQPPPQWQQEPFSPQPQLNPPHSFELKLSNDTRVFDSLMREKIENLLPSAGFLLQKLLALPIPPKIRLETFSLDIPKPGMITGPRTVPTPIIAHFTEVSLPYDFVANIRFWKGIVKRLDHMYGEQGKIRRRHMSGYVFCFGDVCSLWLPPYNVWRIGHENRGRVVTLEPIPVDQYHLGYIY